ncbi:MAG TPA: aldose 1-epimerase [Terracidiphilus sp.]|nr:aldose 1-epimerase [Terracidiphilus sp.]
MTRFVRIALAAIAAASLLHAGLAQSAPQNAIEIGGEKLVTLTRKPVSTTTPEFTSVTLMPGRGMELLSITANFPGKGNVDVLYTHPADVAKKMLDQQDTSFGDLGYRLGAAFLFPYPNRIIGKLSPDGKTLTTSWNGREITLPANNSGPPPNGIKHAMHGLILKAKAEGIRVTDTPGGQQVTGIIHCGNFDGHWFGKTDLVITVTLTAGAVDATVVAHNVGSQDEPVAIGWHPYFNLPSGDRTQVRIHIPGSIRALVNDYGNVFPTGQLVPATGQYDLQAAGGVALDKNFYDDNWSHLTWKNGAVTVKVIDPAAHYGVAIEGLSPEIKTIQMYAPPTQQFVAIEHQYNFADPFGKEWKGMDTGMVTLKPGESTKWHVRLRVFVP